MSHIMTYVSWYELKITNHPGGRERERHHVKESPAQPKGRGYKDCLIGKWIGYMKIA